MVTFNPSASVGLEPFVNFGISISTMDEGSQIQQESDVPELPVVTPHISLGHSGRDDGKTEKSGGPP